MAPDGVSIQQLKEEGAVEGAIAAIAGRFSGKERRKKVERERENRERGGKDSKEGQERRERERKKTSCK